MSERSMEIKVGALVLLSGVLLVAFIFALGDVSVEREVEFYIEYRSTAGLKPGAPLKIAGVAAGKVKDVVYKGHAGKDTGDDSPLVRVTVSVGRRMAASIHEDGRYFITTLGMLGEKYIEVDPGTPQTPMLQPGAVVRGEEPMRLEVMTSRVNRLLGSVTRIVEKNEGKVADVMDEAKGMLSDTRKLITDNRGRIDSTLGRVERISEDTEAVMEAVRGAVGDGRDLKTAMVDARETLSNANAISGLVRGKAPGIVNDLRASLASARSAVSVYEALGQDGRTALSESITKVDAILANAQAVSEDIRAGRGVVGALLQDPELYDDMKEMMRDLKRHPWKFLWKE
jgi:phospholipid/cholesterol/gamma-HCH transport system substrate-binding protein